MRSRIEIKLYFILGLVILHINLNAQDSKSVSAQPLTSDTIPFILTDHNNMIIEAFLNKEDTLQLMLHTAINSMSITKEALVRIKSIQWKNSETVESWGGQSTSRHSINNSLVIGDFEWDELDIWDCEKSGPESDGKFGPNLFKGKVVELNFDEQYLVLHPALPSKMDGYNQLALINEEGFLFIEGTSKVGEHSYLNKYLVHSGYGGTILYDDEFARSNNIGDQIEIIEQKELKDSYGNIIKVNKGKLPEFLIGAQVLKDIPVGFFEGSIGRQSMSVIGGNVLKRFNIFIDAERAYIYLKTNRLFSLAF